MPDDDKTPLDTLLDVFVFAPLGLVLTARDNFPDLIAKGRQQIDSQVTMARFVGRFAVTEGSRQARRRIDDLRSGDAGRPAPAGGGTGVDDAAGGAGTADAEGIVVRTAARAGLDGPPPAGIDVDVVVEPVAIVVSAAAPPLTGEPFDLPAGIDVDVVVEPVAIVVSAAAPPLTGEPFDLPAAGKGRPSPGRSSSGSPSSGSPSSGELAIPGYDTLSASQVVQRMAGLAADELDAVRRYELAHRGRRTILSKAAQLQAGPAV